MNSGTAQSIYYATTGTAPNRQLVFEYLATHCCSYTTTLLYHFQAIFYENNPGVVTFEYYQAYDGGSSATVGVQSKLLLKSMFLTLFCQNFRFRKWNLYGLSFQYRNYFDTCWFCIKHSFTIDINIQYKYQHIYKFRINRISENEETIVRLLITFF